MQAALHAVSLKGISHYCDSRLIRARLALDKKLALLLVLTTTGKNGVEAYISVD
jgi:hypothetical protein